MLGSRNLRTHIFRVTVLLYEDWYKSVSPRVRIPTVRHADVAHGVYSWNAGHKIYRHVLMTAPCTHPDHPKYHHILLVMDMTRPNVWVTMTKLVRHAC